MAKSYELVLQYVTAGFPLKRDKRVTIRGDERR
jgi:hypothetical protein